jgi:hypothetical protein
MTENSQLIKNLEALYALLDQPYAWCKGDAWKPDKRAPNGYARCLMEGCREIARGKQLIMLRDGLRETSGLGGHWFSLVQFNDFFMTRKRDVLQLIRDTIERVGGEV